MTRSAERRVQSTTVYVSIYIYISVKPVFVIPNDTVGREAVPVNDGDANVRRGWLT